MANKCQSYNHTIIQAYNHTIIQSYNHTIIQSYNHTIIQSYNHPCTSMIKKSPISLIPLRLRLLLQITIHIITYRSYYGVTSAESFAFSPVMPYHHHSVSKTLPKPSSSSTRHYDMKRSLFPFKAQTLRGQRELFTQEKDEDGIQEEDEEYQSIASEYEGKSARVGNSVGEQGIMLSRRQMIMYGVSSSLLCVCGLQIFNPSAHASTTTLTPTPTSTSTTEKSIVNLIIDNININSTSSTNMSRSLSSSPNINNEQSIDSIDLQKVLQENKINITMTNPQTKAQAYIDQTSFDKIIQPPPPSKWIPAFISKVLLQSSQNQMTTEPIPDYKVFTSSIIAGSSVEVIRSLVLYPLTTIKTRVQYKPPSTSSLQMMWEKLFSRDWHAKDEYHQLPQEEQREDTRIFFNATMQFQNSNILSASNISTTTTLDADDHDDDDDMLQVENHLLESPSYFTQSNNASVSVPPTPPSRFKLTNLYAGILPSLIATVPSSGIYFATRDVSKREIMKVFDLLSSSSSSSVATTTTMFTSSSLMPSSPLISTVTGGNTFTSTPLFSLSPMDDLSITLISAFLGDVLSLAFKTPALAFSVRKQVETIETIDTTTIDSNNDNNNDIVISAEKQHESVDNKTLSSTSSSLSSSLEQFGHIIKDSWKQLPIVILTDIPYLLLKISLLRIFATGHESIAEYTLLNTILSSMCAIITTPFDVVRTRILVDNNGDPSGRLDGGLISKDDASNIDRGWGISTIISTMQSIIGDSVIDSKRQNEMTSSSNKVIYNHDYDHHEIRSNRNIGNLFAGWYERLLYLGISIAWFDPIRTLLFIGIRDLLLLELLR